jgi:hypothetical protein
VTVVIVVSVCGLCGGVREWVSGNGGVVVVVVATMVVSAADGDGKMVVGQRGCPSSTHTHTPLVHGQGLWKLPQK